MRTSVAILALSLGLFAAEAHAQAPAAAEPIVLRVEQGQVMVSQGGEFVAAETGTVLQPGDRIMVAEDGAASVFYDSACRGDYSQPGVHVIARRCDAPVGTSTAAGLGTPALIAAGVAAVALAVSGGSSDDNPSPISR